MDAARAVAEQAGFVDVHIVDDLTGRPRVLVGETLGRIFSMALENLRGDAG